PPFGRSTARAPTAVFRSSLHDALPIYRRQLVAHDGGDAVRQDALASRVDDVEGHRWMAHASPLAEPAPDVLGIRKRIAVREGILDRKSTRLNSSHQIISYAVFCLKKKI